MFETFLVPANTVVTAKGEGAATNLESAASRAFLLVLDIRNVVEQEALDVSIHGSSDNSTWTPKPIVSFPQKFYRGQAPLLLDLTNQPEIRFVRAHWDVQRWGRGPETPMFEFSVTLKEISPELLAEARAEAAARV